MNIYAAVFLLSVSSITFEILLARIFSISQWNHLAFMVISMALFGLAASGTVLSMRDTGGRQLCPGMGDNRIQMSVLLYSVSALASFLVLNRLPLDYLKTFNTRVMAVTLEQIRDTFQRRVTPETMVTIIVGGES